MAGAKGETPKAPNPDALGGDSVRVIVVGAGEVGQSIAEELAPKHDVVVIDIDEALINELTYAIDVLTLHGDGTSLATLEEAGVESADILIASTDNDEVNIVSCNVASVAADVFTIARVKNPELLETWSRMNRAMGVDFMVCSDLQTAETIVDIVGLPAAHDVDRFAGGHVMMAEFRVPADSDVADQTVEEADRFDSLTFVGVVRDGEVEIAHGGTVLRPSDYVVVIGSPESVHAFAKAIDPSEMEEAEEVVIVGGSEIGFQVARILGRRGLQPRVIESDERRARELAERLPEATVLHSDATDVDFLEREHVDRADAIVAALRHDEMNLLIGLLAKQLGVERTVSLVETGAYVRLFEAVGIDVAVNPRQITAEEIVRFTREMRTENVSLVHDDLAEVIEIEITETSQIAGRTIEDITRDIPSGVVVGAITRDMELITPRGATTIEPGDHVILFVETEHLDAITDVI